MDRTTGKVEVTAHNHGFAVDAPLDAATATPYGEATVSHVCLNDDVVEGLELRDGDGRLIGVLGAVPPRGRRRPARRGVPLRPLLRPDEARRRLGREATPSDRGWMPDAEARPTSASVLVIGAGPIVIGQACEFDYSGTQACRVLREEGIRVVLVNSNPATIMTDPEFADATYVEPITRSSSSR